jgi:hypothetical protein
MEELDQEMMQWRGFVAMMMSRWLVLWRQGVS